MNGDGKNVPDKGQKWREHYLERKGNEDATKKKKKKKRDIGRGRGNKIEKEK